MSTDLKQFHDAFFEESLEAVDDMETGLLNLDPVTSDGESINTIFRAAHSIKGCSATFGFSEISDFVHVMETVLDEMRDGNLAATQELVELLLKALDILRVMLVNTRDGTALNQDNIDTVHNQLKAFLDKEQQSTAQDKDGHAVIADDQKATEWEIHFTPNLEILKTGNDPLRMFSVLSEFGEIRTQADISGLVDFRVIDPEDCYLSWILTLKGAATKDEISEIFEWVEDDCKVSIKPAISSTPLDSEPSAPTSISASTTIPQSVAATPEKSTAAPSSTDSASIRVGIDKVDTIINMVGELVITQSMLEQLGEDFEDGHTDSSRFEKLRAGLIQLERNTRELQESVMRIRMLPISYVFNRVPRIVHDLSKKLGKEVDIKMSGESTELDKTVLEKIGDPLVHLIRNSLDHGIEQPDVREKNGKPRTGTVSLTAYHKGGNIIVEVQDDGAGLPKDKITSKALQKGLIDNIDSITDEHINDLIFHPGFSTAETVSDVSGRGVGMDVVKKNIKALGGRIEVESIEGTGTKFTVRLPLTLAILDGQLVRVGKETYIVPLVSIIESLQIKSEKINVVAGQAELYKLRDEYIPFIRLHELFGLEADTDQLQDGLMVIVEGDGKRAGLVVDDLLSQQQVVIKSLETNFKRVEGLSGATILGDGTVALIVDVSGLISLSHKHVSGIAAA
ncbi:MAG: chemotaxis protein CheA [Gammaproteobacteria bacterium]|jgi:two-component system chemotaxis sensor kinase CheA